VISANTMLELSEITDPDVARAVATFVHAAYCIGVANDPRTTTSGEGGRSNKPGSRPPGRQQCAHSIKRILRLAQDADNEWGNLTTQLQRDDEPIESIGGVRLVIQSPAGKSVGRRADGTFTDEPRGPRLPNLSQEP
jgi:hypothetical protein